MIDETLLPLKKSIDGFSERLEIYEEKQNEFFSDSNRNIEQLRRKLDALKNEFTNDFKFELINLFEKILTDTLNQSELLRNIIVIRTILYVFLLGTKASRIDSSKITDWQKIVTFAHRRAAELYSQELTNSNDPNFENNVVGKLSGELFNEISKQIKESKLT